MKILQQFFILLSVFILTGCLETSRKAPSEFTNKYENQTVLYSTRWCGYCTKMRKILTENYIPFIEIDIEASEAASIEFKQLGGKGIPMVLLKGRIVDGFAPKAVLDLAHGK